MDLKNYLEQYRDLTLLLIDKIQNNEDLSNFVRQRDNIIKKIGDLDFSKEEIRSIYLEFNIEMLEQKLEKAIEKEKVETRRKIEKLKKARVARNSYVKMEDRPISLYTRS